jgi:type IV secretion system protein VirB4
VFLEIQGVAVTPARRTRLARALTLLAEEPREHRTLSEFVVQVQDPELRAAFAPYLVGGTYGQLFDAARDAVGDAAFQVFELKHLLALGDRVVAPAFLYLAHRVERTLTGRPTLTVVEEIHALLGRHGFPDVLRTWLLTQRKRNGAVVMVFHTPAQLEALPAKAVVVESCLTRILLPNAEATTQDNARLYRELGLSDREVALVAAAVPKRDYYVRSSLGSRLVRLDLGLVARAFLGTPVGLSPDGVRGEVSEIEAAVGSEWPRVWLAQQGVEPPAGAGVRATGAGTGPERATRLQAVLTPNGPNGPNAALLGVARLAEPRPSPRPITAGRVGVEAAATNV